MKVVYASTKEQEEIIQELVNDFYQDVFPNYFSDGEIEKFEQMNVLHMPPIRSFDTLKEAYQVITALQTLISILENDLHLDEYEEVFWRNAKALEKFGFFFPFTFDQFKKSKREEHFFSVYVKSANDFLI